MRTVQQYYDDNRDKILFDVRALEEYEKETIEASIHYYWEDMIKVLEDNKEEFEAKYSKDTPIYILCYTGQKSEEIEDMVPCLRCVVEQCTFSVADNILQFSVFKLGAFDQSVEIVDIGFFMFAVVEADCFSRDCRSEGVCGVGKIRLSVYHLEYRF